MTSKHGHHEHDDLRKSHDDHRDAAISAMRHQHTAEERHRAQLQVQQQYFDKAIADARADTSLTKDALLDGLEKLNEMYKSSTDEIVAAVQHGVK